MTKSKMSFEPIGNLLNESEEEHPWLVDQILPTAGLSVLAGKPKAGKSTMARSLALAVARGKPWLDKFMTTQGAVIYLALEEKRQELARHFRAMGTTADDPIRLFVNQAPENGLAQVRAEVEESAPALVIIDPLLRLVRVEDANDYALVTRAFEPLLALARETNAHVLALHHIGKGDHTGGDSILGSTAIYGAVDTALLLTRSDHRRVLSSVQRYGQDLEPIALEIDETTRNVVSAGTCEEANQTRIAQQIQDCLASRATALTEEQLHDIVEGKKILKQRALRHLVDQGRISRAGEGRRGSPYLYSISDSLAPTLKTEPESPTSRRWTGPLMDPGDIERLRNSALNPDPGDVTEVDETDDQEFYGSRDKEDDDPFAWMDR